MKTLTLCLATFCAVASPYDDPDLDPMGRFDRGSRYEEPVSGVDRYFGGRGPAVVMPVQPGSGPSLIGRDQIMTDHQYCARSVVDGAMVCQSH